MKCQTKKSDFLFIKKSAEIWQIYFYIYNINILILYYLSNKMALEAMKWTKEDLHEVEWVKQQTKLALADLQKEVLYTKESDGVMFDVDTSLNYLQKFKDAKTWSEMVSKNSWTTIMAIQILLKNKWYDVGKIDGILRIKWKATSRTMEAVKKFQVDNWLNPDGVPRPDTLRKLLGMYESWWWTTWWTVDNGQVSVDSSQVSVDNGQVSLDSSTENVKDITEKQYEALCKKTSLTDDEVKQVVKYANKNDNESLRLGWLTSITDKQAEELWKVKELQLDWLTRITDKQAEELWKVKERLSLRWLTSITDKQAEELSKVEKLFIWESFLTPKQKQILKKHIS